MTNISLKTPVEPSETKRTLSVTMSDKHLDILREIESVSLVQIKGRRKINRSILIRCAIENLSRDFKNNSHEILYLLSKQIE